MRKKVGYRLQFMPMTHLTPFTEYFSACLNARHAIRLRECRRLIESAFAVAHQLHHAEMHISSARFRGNSSIVDGAPGVLLEKSVYTPASTASMIR